MRNFSAQQQQQQQQQQRQQVNRPNQKPGRPDTGRPDTGRPDIARPGVTLPGTQRPGADRNVTTSPGINNPPTGTPRNRPDFSRSDRPGKGRPGIDRPGTDRTGINRPGTDVVRSRPDITKSIPTRPDGKRQDVNRPNFDRPGDRSKAATRDRDFDRRRDPNRPALTPNVPGRDIAGRRDGWQNFTSRNFTSNNNWHNNWNNFNHNFNNRQNQWGNYWGKSFNNDWRRSNWYNNFNRYGYRNNFYPWWGAVPGLGWNWGGWGWGWGWPQWGWGYGGWGGYGYGYGDYARYYGDVVPTQVTVINPPAQVVYQPTAEQVQNAEDFYSLAVQAFQAGQYQDAIRYSQHAMVDNPRNPQVILLMAQALFATGDYDAAADAIQMAQQMTPEDQWGAIAGNYAQYYPNIQDYTNQLRALEQSARNANPPDPAQNFLLGYHYGYLGYPQQAVTQLDKALDARQQDAGGLQLRNRFASQAGLAARAQGAAPQQEQPAPNLAEAPPDQQKRPASIVTASKPTQEQLYSAADWVAAGEQAFKEGKYQDAAANWQHAMVDNPGDAAVVLLMAQGLFALGRYPDAAGAVQMAMQLLPESEWGNVVKKHAELYADPSQYTAQLKELEKARDAKPDDPALRFLLGYHYGYLGQTEQALRELDKASELQPQDLGAKKLRELLAAGGANQPAAPATPPGQ